MIPRKQRRTGATTQRKRIRPSPDGSGHGKLAGIDTDKRGSLLPWGATKK